jgi:hypothetical protein
MSLTASSTTRRSSSIAKSGGYSLSDVLPKEYILNPKTTEPILYYLPRLLQVVLEQQQQSVESISSSSSIPTLTLRQVFKAAAGDIRLHRARVQAGLARDPKLIKTYQLEKDVEYATRSARIQERKALQNEIGNDTELIWNDLLFASTSTGTIGLTQAEQIELNMTRWQRALEWYFYNGQDDEPTANTNTSITEPDGTTKSSSTNSTSGGGAAGTSEEEKTQLKPTSAPTLSWQVLFEKLLESVSEDQDLSGVLQQASEACQNLLQSAQQHVEDTQYMVQAQETHYRIRLEAHGLYARHCLHQIVRTIIEQRFNASGRAALQIGHQLEFAELQRAKCEAASVLIRRWWMLETLAEHEANSNQIIPVAEEVSGIIPPNAAKLDPLFTRPENSLEASKSLKQLRAVIRSRSNNSNNNNAGNLGTNVDNTTAANPNTASNNNNTPGNTSTTSANTAVAPANAKRFEHTAHLIMRVSEALEQRLLASFTKVYSAGGSYDFSPKPRVNAIDWRELQNLARSLLLFDSGRNLHKRYVDMVVAIRFPELFASKSNANAASSPNNSNNNNDSGTNNNSDDPMGKAMVHGDLDTFGDYVDMDATRTKLSTLFRRVSDVCTAEFALIAHVFGSSNNRTDLLDGSEEMPLVVARALLQRVISDPHHGLQAHIHNVLASIDKRGGDFSTGAKKLDTFVMIHEKASALFETLKVAAERMLPSESSSSSSSTTTSADPSSLLARSSAQAAMSSTVDAAATHRNAVESLKGFLTSQELALSNTHRQSYINLELRLLHHDCCASLDTAGCTLVKGPSPRPDPTLAEKGILEEYRAPILPLHKESLIQSGLTGILTGPLKPSVLRQPLIHAADSLHRSRVMFGTHKRGGEATSRVILSIYNQMCFFYGEAYLYPVIETLRELLPTNPPSQPPQLPFDEDQDAHDLGVPPAFWVALERIHSASKSFDRELWAEEPRGMAALAPTALATTAATTTPSSPRVWETLQECGDAASMAFARGERTHFYAELERRGEAAILRALDALSTHIQWILVMGGESMLATGGTRITLGSLTGSVSGGGPYAIPTGSSLDTPNSPAVKALAYCLRVQFVHVQSAVTPKSLAAFWTVLSMRLYDILVARLLQHYYITTVGAVILSRDVEALRSVSMLAGNDHLHWDQLRELLTLYMSPPDSIKTLLMGPEGESSKGLFAKAGRERSLVFLSRRNDYRYKTTAGLKKSVWVTDLLDDMGITDDPTDQPINIGLFAAGRKHYN